MDETTVVEMSTWMDRIYTVTVMTEWVSHTHSTYDSTGYSQCNFERKNYYLRI